MCQQTTPTDLPHVVLHGGHESLCKEEALDVMSKGLRGFVLAVVNPRWVSSHPGEYPLGTVIAQLPVVDKLDPLHQQTNPLYRPYTDLYRVTERFPLIQSFTGCTESVPPCTDSSHCTGFLRHLGLAQLFTIKLS